MQRQSKFEDRNRKNVMRNLGITTFILFLLLQTPGREGWGSVIITPGDRNEDTTTAHCVFLPKAAGVPHAGRPLFDCKSPERRCSLMKGAGAVPRSLVLNGNHRLHRLYGDRNGQSA
jgi:hypothetical protein